MPVAPHLLVRTGYNGLCAAYLCECQHYPPGGKVECVRVCFFTSTISGPVPPPPSLLSVGVPWTDAYLWPHPLRPQQSQHDYPHPKCVCSLLPPSQD